MPKLVLTFNDRVIKEFGLEADVTIGRLPDSTIVIDNPAVSGQHARVFLDGDNVIVEDLHSKNGTYLNEEHVVRATLKHGDVLLIGKHRIVFDEGEVAEDAGRDGAVLPTLGKTTYLDTKEHRAMLARLREERARQRAAAGNSAPATPEG